MIYPVTNMSVGQFCYGKVLNTQKSNCPTVIFNTVGAPVDNTSAKVVITNVASPNPKVFHLLPVTMYGVWDVSDGNGTGLDFDYSNPVNKQAVDLFNILGELTAGVFTVAVKGHIIQ